MRSEISLNLKTSRNAAQSSLKLKHHFKSSEERAHLGVAPPQGFSPNVILAWFKTMLSVKLK